MALPELESTVAGARSQGAPPLCYLNNAGTSWPKAPGCAAAVAGVMAADPRAYGALFEDARASIAHSFGIVRPEDLLLTPGCTSAIATVLRRMRWTSADTVVTSAVEHEAVLSPVADLVRDVGVAHRVVPYRPGDAFDVPAFSAILAEGSVRWVVVTAASNVTGERLPIEEIVSLAHRHGARVLLDAAQLAGLVPMNFEALDVDAVAFAGHKGPLAPIGVGGLWVRKDGVDRRGGTLGQREGLWVRGEQGDSGSDRTLGQERGSGESGWDSGSGRSGRTLGQGGAGELWVGQDPGSGESRRDSGSGASGRTLGQGGAGELWVGQDLDLEVGFCDVGSVDLPSAVAMARSLAWLASDAAPSAETAATLRNTLRAELQRHPGCKVIGGAGPSTGVLSVLFDRLPVGEADALFAAHNIIVRSGRHCAAAAVAEVGAPQGTVRFSFGRLNTAADVDAVMRVVRSL